ncbi:hypothetical protein MMC26_002784 [Xylographa opegraphella]|nr:hypothetical protein [Xylographa opegraphella]
MENLHQASAISDPKEHERDRLKTNSDVSTSYHAETHAEASKTMANMGIMVSNEGNSTTSTQNTRVRNQLSPTMQAEDIPYMITDDDWLRQIATEVLQHDENDKEAAELLEALTNPESSSFPAPVYVPDDLGTSLRLRLASCDNPTRAKWQILWDRLKAIRFDDHLPLNETAALALDLEPGSLKLEDYTVSWKPSGILCFVEYAYQDTKSNLMKTWLLKASHHMLQNPGDIAKVLYVESVQLQVGIEQGILRLVAEKAKANLRENPLTTAGVANDDWVPPACEALIHRSLVRETIKAITELRAAGFTRAKLTLEKLSEFASNINNSKLDLSTLVEYISSLPPIMESQSLASEVIQSGELDVQSTSHAATYTTRRRNERKLKKKLAQQHAAQVLNTPQTETTSNGSMLSNNTRSIPVDQENRTSPGVILEDPTDTTKHISASKKKKNKQKKKGKQGLSQTVAGDHEEVAETCDPFVGDDKEFVGTADHHQTPRDHEEALVTGDSENRLRNHEEVVKTTAPMPGDHEESVEAARPHEPYPVFQLAEPNLAPMKNSPTTYFSRSVERPVDHRKVRSATELELRTLQIPSEQLAEAKERLLSEPSPLSLEEVRNHTREIEHQIHNLEQENSRMTREIVGIRERSLSHEDENMTSLDGETTLLEDHSSTAMKEITPLSSDQQALSLGITSKSNDLLSVPVITRRQSMRRVITLSPLPTIPESRHENAKPPSVEDLALRNRIIHRRCHSETLHTFKTKVDSHDPMPLGGSDDNEDFSEYEGVDLQQITNKGPSTRLSLREEHPYTPWTTLLKWQYYSNDQELRAIPRGTSAYRFPRPVKKSPQNYRAGNMSDCPVYMFPNFTDNPEPIVNYNEKLDCYEITPHSRPWRGDLRSDIDHPDYLPPGKLCQYQAYEYAGFTVWRHDRDPFYCKLFSCGKITRDPDITTVICHGCGTKSRVRYCTKAHLIQDIPNHWKICGTPAEVYAHPIDPGSQPDRFYRRYPAIIDVDEDPVLTVDFKNRSFQKHRQQTFAIFNKGQYTLFLGGSTSEIVEWPEDVAAVYKPRVERLLNMAFFRQANTGALEYLFALLRYCLRLQQKWTDATERILTIQFKLEFKYDTRLGSEADPCECLWSGVPALVKDCTPSCRAMYFDKFGIVFGGGMRAHLERWEAKYWPLRIWQRQHPTIRGWEYRLRGEGFPGVADYQRLESGYVPIFGKGWEGFGAEDADPKGGWRLDD